MWFDYNTKLKSSQYLQPQWFQEIAVQNLGGINGKKICNTKL